MKTVLGGALCNGYHFTSYDGLALNTHWLYGLIIGECDAYWTISYFKLNGSGDGSDMHLLHITPYFPYCLSP
jgi:hypothetical protein